jgi:hypothetical protein
MAGTTFHVFDRCSRYGMEKLETPIALTLPKSAKCHHQPPCLEHEGIRTSLKQGLHLSPGLLLVPTSIGRTGSIGVQREKGGSLVCDKSNGPVDEVQVKVVGAEGLEGFVKALCDTVVVCVPATRWGREELARRKWSGVERKEAREERRECQRRTEFAGLRTYSLLVRKTSSLGTPDSLMP